MRRRRPAGNTWRALTQRMRYHFGKGWWKSYKGEKKYPRRTRWTDTEEAAVVSAVETAAITAEVEDNTKYLNAIWLGYRRQSAGFALAG